MVLEDRQPELDRIPGGYFSEYYLEEYARSHYWTSEIENQFGLTNVRFFSGTDEVRNNSSFIYQTYDDCDLIIFVDHGHMRGFSETMDSEYLRNNKVYLKHVTVLDLACLTGAYYVERNFGEHAMVHAVQNIRRGSMVYMGATDVSYWHNMFDDVLYGVYINRTTIGKAYKDARNSEYDNDKWNLCTTLKGDIY